MNFKKNSLLFFFILISKFSYATTISVSGQYGIDEIEIDSDVNTEFQVDFKQKEIVLLASDVTVPIQTNPAEYSIFRPGESLVRITDSGEVSTVVTQNVVAASNGGDATFTHRPTIFVTICGFQLDVNDDDVCAGLRGDVDSKLVGDGRFQYIHLMANWNSNEQIDRQDEDLADYILKELRGKSGLWDVVVIGYSRGGIFAHDMSEFLVKSESINNLYTVLLDPTTAKEFRDVYPQRKYTHSGTNHYASLYYDRKPFSGGVNIFQYSDENISGFNNFGYADHYLHSNHIDFPSDWAEKRFLGFYFRFMNTKSIGSYREDGISGSWVVDVDSRAKNVFEGGMDLTFDNNGVGVGSFLCVDVDPSGTGASTLCASSEMSVSIENGIYAETVIPVVSASRLVVNSKKVEIANSTPVQQFHLGIENSEITYESSNFLNVATLKTVVDPSELELDVNFDYLVDDLELNINVIDFKGSISNELANFEDSVVGTVVDVGDSISDAASDFDDSLRKCFGLC